MAFVASTDLLVSQWGQALTLKAVIDIGLDVLREEIELPAQQLQRMMSLDTAEGVWLDLIGERLGLRRPYTVGDAVGVDSGETFGYDSAGVGFDQARFADIASLEPQYPILDELYRKMIRARSVTVLSQGTVPSFFESVSYVDPNAIVKDLFDMSVVLRTDDSFCMDIALSSGALPLTGGVNVLKYLWDGSLYTIVQEGVGGSSYYPYSLNSNSVELHDGDSSVTVGNSGIATIAYDRNRHHLYTLNTDTGKIEQFVNNRDGSFTLGVTYPQDPDDLTSLNLRALVVDHNESMMYFLEQGSNSTRVRLRRLALPLTTASVATPVNIGTTNLGRGSGVLAGAAYDGDLLVLTNNGKLFHIDEDSPFTVTEIGETGLSGNFLGLGYDDDHERLYCVESNVANDTIMVYRISTDDASATLLYTLETSVNPQHCLAYVPFLSPRTRCTSEV